MANKSISQLTAGAAVSGTDIFPDVQTAGVGPVKVTATQLATYFWNSPTLVTPSLGAATATSINIGGATLGSNVLAYNGSAIGTNLALGGATIGTNALAVTGTTALAGATTVSTGGLTIGVAGTTGGTIALKGSTAGTLTLQVPATVTDYSITFPSAVAAANGYILTSTTAGVTSWTNPTALGVDLDVGTTAITNGAAGRLLFQGAGDVLQESANLTFSTAALTLGVQDPAGLAGVQGSLILANTAAGAFPTTLQASNSASAAWTLTLPISAGTNNYVLTTNGSGVSSWSQVSLTAGVTGTLPVANGGTGASSASITAFNNITGYTASGATGTTSTDLVFSTSPTLTTPTLGVASATSINKVAITAPATSATLTIADGKTATFSNSITFAGTDGTTMTFPSASSSIGYLNIPQNAQTSAYVAVVGDVGKHIDITTGGVTVNASVFSVGDVFTIYNDSGSSQNITAGAGVTFRLAGTATSGTPRTVAQYGLATVLCVTGGASPVFVLSGAGVA